MNEVRNVLVGFKLGKEESQLSYYNRNAQEPVSVPTKVGTNLFRFPTVLARKRGREEWHFGLEAEYFGTRDDFDLVWGKRFWEQRRWICRTGAIHRRSFLQHLSGSP